MQKTILLLNRFYVSFLHVISFFAFLSLQIKILSLTSYYDEVIGSTLFAYVVIVALSITSAFFTHLLIRLLRKAQQYQW